MNTEAVLAVISDDERLARAGLSRVCEPAVPDLLLCVREQGPVAVWDSLVRRTPLLPRRLAEALEPRAAACSPQRDLDNVGRIGGRLVCPGDPEWPTTIDDLAHHDHEAMALWVRGHGRLDATAEAAVSVVGARAATDYGTYVAGEMGADLVGSGWSVVSGGAYGIDSAAHRGALAAGGTTVAVLASGVDVPYPQGHAALFDRIREHGLLVSEWAPGSAPRRGRFLVRNRVIAALAAGVVVVEAARRSGALRTAHDAVELGRHVMAVPGPVSSQLSAGCHWLLRRGATLVTSAAEVVEEVGRLALDLAPEPTGESRPVDDVPAHLRQVFDAVPVVRPVSADRIAIAAGVPPAEALGVLGQLLGAGHVERFPTGWRLSPETRRRLSARRAVAQA